MEAESPLSVHEERVRIGNLDYVPSPIRGKTYAELSQKVGDLAKEKGIQGRNQRENQRSRIATMRELISLAHEAQGFLSSREEGSDLCERVMDGFENLLVVSNNEVHHLGGILYVRPRVFLGKDEEIPLRSAEELTIIPDTKRIGSGKSDKDFVNSLTGDPNSWRYLSELAKSRQGQPEILTPSLEGVYVPYLTIDNESSKVVLSFIEEKSPDMDNANLGAFAVKTVFKKYHQF